MKFENFQEAYLHNSKRGFIGIFDPNEILTLENIDVSCTIGLQFFIRNSKLFMSTFMRANDAYRGILSDVFSFTFIQEMLIQLTDMDFYMLLKRADSYIVNWENYVASFLIQNGKQQFKKQQDARMAQNIQPHEMSSYMQEQPQEQYLNGMYVA